MAAPVVLVVHMGVHRRACEEEVKRDLMKIPDVVEVCMSLVTGHVAIIGMADAATLVERLETILSKPVIVLADFGAAPPAGGGYGMMPPASPPLDGMMPPASPDTSVDGGNGVMPPASPDSSVDGGSGEMSPWSPAPRYAFPAPMVGADYHPCGAPRSRLRAPPVGAGYYHPYVHQPRYAAPPPPAGYYAPPVAGRPWPPHYLGNEAPEENFEDEYRRGRCCSIQ